MKTIQAAIYARVSSEQQAAAHTIESQLAELAERVQSDGTPVPAKRQSVDDGYKRAALVRPALERLRDLATRRVVNGVHVPFARPIGAQLRLSSPADRRVAPSWRRGCVPRPSSRPKP